MSTIILQLMSAINVFNNSAISTFITFNGEYLAYSNRKRILKSFLENKSKYTLRDY